MSKIILLLVSIAITFVYAQFTIQSNETFTLSNNEKVTFDTLSIESDATFKANTDTNISIENDWTNNGNFEQSTSYVHFTGSDESTIKGDNTFYSFKANKPLTVEAQKTQKFIHSIEINGNGILQNLNSDNTGSQAIFDFTERPTYNFDYLKIQDMKNIGITVAVNPPNSEDAGNNILWFATSEDENWTQTTIDTELVVDTNISSYEKFFKTDDNPTIKYVSKIETVEKVTVSSSLIINDVGVSNTVVNTRDDDLGLSTIAYESKNDAASACPKITKIVLSDIGDISTGYASKNNCSTYEDPTLENWDSVKDGIEIEVLETTDTQKELYADANSVIFMDIKLKNKLIIGKVVNGQ